jgi:hypothetical protein
MDQKSEEQNKIKRGKEQFCSASLFFPVAWLHVEVNKVVNLLEKSTQF